MIDGLNILNFEKLPNIYNLAMTLKLLAVCVPLLALQSSSFFQALLFTLIELSHLFFVVFYQFRAKALKSTFILVVRVQESSTLALFGIVSMLYSLRIEVFDKIGRVVSAPTFLLFFLTMMIEYIQLVFLVISKIISAIKSKKKTKKLNSVQNHHIQRNETNEEHLRYKRIEKDPKYLEYWKNHPFVVIREIKSKKPRKKKMIFHDARRQRRAKSFHRGSSYSRHRSKLHRSELSSSILPRSQLHRSEIHRSELHRSGRNSSVLHRSELSHSQIGRRRRKRPIETGSRRSLRKGRPERWRPKPRYSTNRRFREDYM